MVDEHIGAVLPIDSQRAIDQHASGETIHAANQIGVEMTFEVRASPKKKLNELAAKAKGARTGPGPALRPLPYKAKFGRVQIEVRSGPACRRKINPAEQSRIFPRLRDGLGEIRAAVDVTRSSSRLMK